MVPAALELDFSWIRELLPNLKTYLPFLITLTVVILALAVARALLAFGKQRPGDGLSVSRQLFMLALNALGVVIVILALPVSDTLRGQLLGLLGLVITGVVAFSSTTFVSNAMAGLMLRAVGNFRIGDWVEIEEQFGRVTERGLFHTEIQTEDRDLATLPNLYLATHPVKLVRASGTIVSTKLSLGYDVDRVQLETLLVAAAKAIGLEEPFVQILNLGDFSVTYRVAGFLPEVKHLISVRSKLRASVLDVLHGAGIEIVSPTFMNQRQLAEGVRFVPPKRVASRSKPEVAPEDIIFDKADLKESLAKLRSEREKLVETVAELNKAKRAAKDSELSRIEAELQGHQARLSEIDAQLEQAAKDPDAEED